MIWLILQWLIFCAVVSAVQVPSSPLVAAPGSDVTLNCSFAYTAADDPQRVVLTWQREQEVVHSYYYSKDQLQKQSPAYMGRTQLFPQQLKVGNASLRLKDVQGRDQGNYTCHVANEQGSSKGFLLLLLAVAYEDPLLTIAISSSWNYIVLTYRSQGYPEAKVHWLNHTGSDITKHSQTSQCNCGGGLLALNSHLTVERIANLSYTFQLANPVVNQSITRTVTVTNNALQ
ncbi:CD276 antigen-like isoform X2 [Lepisosteus oculatus]|uniref:CD276 antigen-like isoform X2 n=1 Tax=Lepisosteus oculatus TaxID=7918 RepID=UPI0037160E4E